VPNTRRDTVYLGDIINSDSFQGSPSPLVFAMGKSLSGQPVCADLTSMPHLLMAGATGAGKSVAINSLICSVVMKSSPADVRMILVDPKMLELSVYEGIPHLLMPVITEPDRASHALKWAAAEMERRYKLMQFASVRNIAGFNQFLSQANPARLEELRIASGGSTIERLPYILLVIDELADLMLTAPKDVESSIQRLAQKARASGIHMVLATQRPSVDIITGVIKANLPCRLSFQVVSKHDSRTILDQVGAEKLLGRGDMLFQRPGSGRLERIQGALVGDEEVLGLVATLKASGTVAYDDSIMNWIDEELQRERAGEHDGAHGFDSEEDPKYSEAMQIAQSHGVVSASFLQRHLKIGYNRAARIVEHMERCGLVAKADGAKPRRWLGPSA
jgi:S-DNA-T family DNA segregation ATPase FtsK/SpoIIIE